MRGFHHIFGVDLEEVAVRFYTLFVEPEGQPKTVYINFIRFCYVIKNMVDTLSEKCAILEFDFFNYYKNGSIKSLDIVNLISAYDQKKMGKIQEVYT